MRVNQNIAALASYNAARANQTNLAKGIARLSTGLRINSAADDAAGLAISEKMRAQVQGLDQAARNAQDGISMIQTAEGALSEVHSILQRMRELSVQAANDTLTAEDRSFIQLETDQLKEEINRIAAATQFNKKKLLDGSASVLWSSDKLSTVAHIRGGLTSVDQFGQRVSAEGNYQVEITAEPGEAEIQKSNVLNVSDYVKVKVENVHEPTPALSEPSAVIDIGTVAEGAAGDGWSFASNILTINAGGTYKITGQTLTNGVKVASGTANIILSDVDIDVSAAGACAFEISPGAAVNMYLEGSNSLKSGFDATTWQGRAGIEVTDGAAVTITSAEGDGSTEGSLNVSASDYAAGIGGQGYASTRGRGGSITINGGTITATGGRGDPEVLPEGGAGIGGGNTGSTDGGGTITINGGNITAIGGHGSAGIGSGVNAGYPDPELGDGGTEITITGGTITATGGTSALGGSGGAGIGGGAYSNSGVIRITGGSITATGGPGAQDVGYGYYGRVSDVVWNVDEYVTQRKKLSDIKQFYDAGGVCLMNEPQTITIYQGDGRSADVTLYAYDTMFDVAEKINDAIAFGLGQSAYVEGAGTDQFCTLSDGTDYTSESILTREPIYEGGYQRNADGSLASEPSVAGHRTYATMLVRSALPGAAGELTITGGEELLKSLGLSTIQESRESRFTAAVYDAHSGALVSPPQAISGNTLYGAVTDAVDVTFDPLAGISVKWNEITKRFDFSGDEGTYTTYVHLSDNTTILQVGANEGEDMALHFGSFDTSALGLDEVLAVSRESAARALTVIDSAIGTVSRQRAMLGAYQNRLEHTNSNLTAAGENLTSAESRIRDTDMAEEMADFTKLNILQQSGVAMMAQANQIPQAVLSLLR